MSYQNDIKSFKDKWSGNDFHNSEIFYHYTDAHSALGILQGNKIWATYLKHSNDSAEFILGMKLFKEAFINRQFQFNFHETLKNNLLNFIDQEIEKPRIKPLMFCLSKAKDQLSQWRGYADNCAGLSIGFNIDAEKLHTLCRFKEVIYSKEKFLQRIENCLMDFDILANAILDSEGNLNESNGSRLELRNTEAITELLTAFHLAMFFNSLSYKDSAFEEENEWRLIFFTLPEEIKLRVSGSKIVKYCDKDLIGIDIKSILFGARCPKETKESLEFLLEQFPDKFKFVTENSRITFK